MIKNYRLKTKTVAAIRWYEGSTAEVLTFLGPSGEMKYGPSGKYIQLKSHGGILYGYSGDWFVLNEFGKFWVYSNDAFMAKYEEHK